MELPLNQIIHADCLEFMKTLPDKCIDLVLTDPPYGIGKSWSKNHTGGFMTEEMAKETAKWDVAPSDEYFDEIFRISKNQIMWGGNYFSLSPSPTVLIWDKKQQGMHFAEAEIAWTSFRKTTRIFHFGIKSSDTFGNKSHPTQKPIELMKWCIENYSEEGMTILDPFAGSCTTAVACKQLNRNYICIEKEEQYVKIGNERISAQSNSLFAPLSVT